MILVDTNLLLRAIIQDDPRQVKAARDFCDQAYAKKIPLVVHELAMAEVVWVLECRGWGRDQIGISLLELCADGRFAVRDHEVVEAAANHYIENKVSFIDAFQAAYVQQHGLGAIVSFDRDYDKLGVKRIEPS